MAPRAKNTSQDLSAIFRFNWKTVFISRRGLLCLNSIQLDESLSSLLHHTWRNPFLLLPSFFWCSFERLKDCFAAQIFSEALCSKTWWELPLHYIKFIIFWRPNQDNCTSAWQHSQVRGRKMIAFNFVAAAARKVAQMQIRDEDDVVVIPEQKLRGGEIFPQCPFPWLQSLRNRLLRQMRPWAVIL